MDFHRRVPALQANGTSIPPPQAIGTWLQRLHLAAFYWKGEFLHVSRRLTGTRFVLSREAVEPIHSYRILALMLGLELGWQALVAVGVLWGRLRSRLELLSASPGVCQCLRQLVNGAHPFLCPLYEVI